MHHPMGAGKNGWGRQMGHGVKPIGKVAQPWLINVNGFISLPEKNPAFKDNYKIHQEI